MATRGLGTRDLTLVINGEERKFEVSVAEILSEESDADFLTFGDIAADGGGRTYKLHLVAVQDPGTADSLWNLMYDETGTDVEFTIMPKGGTPSVSNPGFEGECTISEPDGVVVGGEADASRTARFTFEVEWICTGKPTRVTA